MMITLNDLSFRHIVALRKISGGERVSYATWLQLLHMDLIDIDDVDDERDVLLPLGKRLLAEAEAAATPPTGAPAAGEGFVESVTIPRETLYNLETDNERLQADNARLADELARARAERDGLALACKTALNIVKLAHGQLDTMVFNIRQMTHVEPERVTRSLEGIKDLTDKAKIRLTNALANKAAQS